MAVDPIVKGSPSKGFFVNMITRDISLGDAILDLLDNSVDGIRRLAGEGARPDDLSAYSAQVAYDTQQFEISDNCGGIPIRIAKEYAFRFGKPDEAIQDQAKHSIGLYGIGMKRALFKMGRDIDVKSSTGQESFRVHIDVGEWLKQPEQDWDFRLSDVVEQNTTDPVGTRIAVKSLYPSIAREFETPTFVQALLRSIQRDYAFILEHGFKISANTTLVKATMPTLRVSKDVAPIRMTYEDEGVTVEIVAGLASAPPEDDSAQQRYPEGEIYGWYVVCNERVVVTADKTTLTGWGVDPVPAWHYQFYGFLGVVRFESDDPKLLPWRTTKRAVDESNAVYKRALAHMRDITKQFTDYTNKRKSELAQAREAENSAKSVPVSHVPKRDSLRLPQIQAADVRRICFDKPLREINAVARALGIPVTSFKRVGIAAFDYVKDREVPR